MAFAQYAFFGAIALTVAFTVLVVSQKNKEAETSNKLAEEQQNQLAFANSFYDLNEQATLDKLQNQGLQLSRSARAHFSVAENLTTGYQWILEEDGGECANFITVSSSYDAPHFAEDEIEPMGAAGTKYFTLTGASLGACKWRAAYARSWSFDWGDRIGNAAQLIEISVQVLAN